MTNLSFTFPTLPQRSAFAYLASKIAQHRVVAIGESHRGGRESAIGGREPAIVRYDRCVRSFLAEAIVRTRPSVLALELNAEEFRNSPFAHARGVEPPSGVLRIVPTRDSSGRIVLRTEPCRVYNREVFWMGVYAMSNWDTSYHDMLFRIATASSDLVDLHVRGIDGAPSNSLEVGSGIRRDRQIASEFGRLLRETTGKVVVLMGAAHVSKVSREYDPPSLVGSPRSPRGGFYPLGAYVAAGGVPELDPDDYWAIRCLTEADPLLTDQINLATMVRSATIRYSSDRVKEALVRAYDLLSSIFFAYQCGLDTLELEEACRSLLATTLLTATELVRVPPVAEELGTNTPPVQVTYLSPTPTFRYPLASTFDGLLMFRDLESWDPENDPLSIPRRRLHTGEVFSEPPSEYYIPVYQLETEANWRARWERLLPDMQGNISGTSPALRSGLFGGPLDDLLRFRRVTFAIPSTVLSAETEMMLIGYGFNPRDGDGGQLQVFLRASSAPVTVADVAVAFGVGTDRIIKLIVDRAQLASAYMAFSTVNATGQRVLMCDVKVVFPEMDGATPYTSILLQAVNIVFSP